MSKRVVLAYSGGLDTSVALRWMTDNWGVEVVAVAVDVGQGVDAPSLRERALAAGAVEAAVIDARQEYADDVLVPAIRANALYEGRYPLVSALSRPVIVKHLVAEARAHGATAVAHGCTGKGNDQVRIDVTVRAMNPSLQVIAPVREWNMSRDEEIAYAQERGLPVKPSKSIFSVDQNIWGRSVESGPLENPGTEPPEDAFEWTASPEEAPDEPRYLELGFQEGVPARVDGKAMDPLELVSYVNEVAGAHGVGRIDHIEDRLVGIKSREVYECPAASVVIDAHRDLEKLVLTRHELDFKAHVEREWAWLVYSGLWLEPLRPALDRFIAATQHRVTGSVKVKLYKGTSRVVGRSSDYSIYDIGLSTYGRGSTFDQKSAVGFIELWGLQSRVASGLSSQAEEKEKNGHQGTKAKEAQ